MNLLERIKKLCNQRGISVYQLEEKIEIGRNTIYQWNKRTPSTEKIQKIADYFNVSTDYLLGRTENPNPLKTEEENIPPEYFAIQRKSKKLNQKDQQRLLKIMEATFDDLDNGDFEEDDDDDL